MATYNGSTTSAPVTSSITLNVRSVGSSSNGTPAISGLTDAASYQQKYSPGMLMSVFGSQLSASTASAASVPLPVTMGGVAATVNGVAAPLWYVSPAQLNIQIPYQTAVNTSATLTINNNGQVVTSQTFAMTASSPGIFGDPTAHSIGSAARGQTTALYLTGAGAVTPAIATGSTPAPTTPLASLPSPQNTPVAVTVAGVPATIVFAGISPGLVGVTQINFQIPAGIPTGMQPVVVSIAGTASAPAYVNITN
jgi:uncharacterized protein (TIGR03437 family)